MPDDRRPARPVVGSGPPPEASTEDERGIGVLRGLGSRFGMTPRAIQIALGLVWVLDGALQYQPYMFHRSLVTGIILPNAQGQPAPIAWSVTSVAHFIKPDVGVWNFLFATLQLAIGAGLLVRRTVRPTIVVMVLWSALVWWFGEGLGALLTGTASPLTGAPGAVLVYAAIGILVWPPPEGPRPAPQAMPPHTDEARLGVASSAAATGPLGMGAALGTWVVLWVGFAFLWLLPANRVRSSLWQQLSSGAAGEPSWYAHFLDSFAGHFTSVGTQGAWVLALLSLVIGLGPLLTRRPTPFLVAGAVLELGFWVTGMGLGGILTGSGTDPDTGPLVVLLAAALLPTVVAARPTARAALATLWRHPLATAGTVLAVDAALVLAATYPLPPAAAPPPPTTAQQEAGMTPGLPLVEPPNLNIATPPTLDLRLVAERKRFDISGKKVWGESYDGDYVGPTMHFVPGETVNLTLVNKLSTWTNLHFHGMHLSPSGDADNPFINVPPGATFEYHFTVPLDQPLGTFWYHDHEMCMGTSSCRHRTRSSRPSPHPTARTARPRSTTACRGPSSWATTARSSRRTCSTSR